MCKCINHASASVDRLEAGARRGTVGGGEEIESMPCTGKRLHATARSILSLQLHAVDHR